MNYKVYYINLEKSIQRRQFMEKQFSKLGVCAIRILAIEGRCLDKKTIFDVNQQTSFSHFVKANFGEIGVFLSYKKAWSIIEKQDEDYAVLLEDDVLINEDFFVELPDILKELKNNSILDISGRPGFFKKSSISISGRKVCMNCFSTPSLGATGRIYGKLAATRINQRFPYYLAPVDVMLQKIYRHKVQIFSSTKAYVLHSDELVGGTTIQNKSTFTLKTVIRELKRPIWRFSIKLCNFFLPAA